MAPQTRSGGVPPPSRVYHSTPSMRQVRFAPPRRTYGRRQPSGNARPDIRQRTLTQIDFVSSGTPAIEISDSEEDDFAQARDEELADDKENEAEEEEEDDRGKGKKTSRKRRSLGDDSTDTGTKKRKATRETRRRTMGDTPISKYHTQTLTQFLGRDHEEDPLLQDGDDEFDDWLQGPESPSPKRQMPAGQVEARQSSASRQSSVIPQTPAKRGIRFEIPSSSQQSTPMTGRMLDRYGPPDQEKPSPSMRRTVGSVDKKADEVDELRGKPPPPPPPRKLVIEDSFGTESWGSAENSSPVKGTPLKDITEEVVGRDGVSSSATELAATPTRARVRVQSAELGETEPEDPGTPTPGRSQVASSGPNTRNVFEIPDSDEEEDDFGVEEESEKEQAETSNKEEVDDKDTAPTETADTGDTAASNAAVNDGFAAGVETQAVMSELASFEDSSSRKDTPHTPTPPLPNLKPLRRPLPRHPSSSQTQPIESQRVPLATIQSLGSPTNRTDILLPIQTSTLNLITSGHQIDLVLPFRIPVQVTRLWLYEKGSYLRFGAYSEPAVDAEPDQNGVRQWRYHLRQVYELNNPLDEEDMCEEGWTDKDQAIGRYIYLPPAGVGQLLSNLRHALFADTEDDEPPSSPQQLPPRQQVQPQPSAAPRSSLNVSQQVEAQLRSDIAHHATSSASKPTPRPQSPLPDDDDDVLVPSTPLKDRTRHTPRTAKPPIYPSQATTVSQTSTPEKPTIQTRQQPLAPPPPPAPQHSQPPIPQSSSSILNFHDSSSSPVLLLNDSNPTSTPRWSSQLLSKSQMLPDSLVRDDARFPPEIWDSDDDDPGAD